MLTTWVVYPKWSLCGASHNSWLCLVYFVAWVWDCLGFVWVQQILTFCPLFGSRRLMMKRWPYKWRSSEGRRTMPKSGCSKTPQQEEFSLSNDMVEKQTGKKVIPCFSSPLLPPPLPFLVFLSFSPSSLLHTNLSSSAHSPCLNRNKGWECRLNYSGCLFLQK